MGPDLQTRGMADPVVSMRSVSKALGRGVVALDGVDLTVFSRQTMGLAGPNGAGKSTLLRVLLGLVKPTSGSAELFGSPVSAGAEALRRVGTLVDGPGFLPYLSGRKNLELAVRSSGKAITGDEFESALTGSGLGPALDRPYRTYSHGMRYRLGLAQATIGDPDLLVLDEPTTGLDPGHAEEVVAALVTAAQKGTTMLLSSHELPLLERVCTDVTFLNEGRVVLAGTVRGLIESDGSLHSAYLRALGARVEGVVSAEAASDASGS
ncbi:MAG TPA: ABC transporter ATP-binding protein [Acidimicrobiales bacterium]